MCGIVGEVDTRPVDAASTRALVPSLHRRGPDAEGVREFSGCVLGHTRLRIVDLDPRGDQPMSNEDGTVWVVYNGELYNHAELRRDLEAHGHRFRSATDTEVLVHLYEEHGERLVERLRGMFAFGLWDEARRVLLLARDRLGIKPLYYATQGSGLRFASTSRAVAPDAALERDALAAYLRLGWVPGPRTVRRGVLELPPGCTLSWRDGTSRLRRYWSPVERDGEGGGTASLREVLRDAVARHLIADVPVGVFLSSGIDSTAVAALAAEHSPNVMALTISVEGALDEAAGARRIAENLSVDHRVVRVSGEDVRAALPRIIGAMDQPTVDGVNTWVVCRAARQQGLTVALSGLGGDELFAGYSTFRHVPRLARLGRVTRPLPLSLRALPGRTMDRFPRLRYSRARRVADVLSDGPGAAYGAVRGLFSAAEVRRLLPGCDPEGWLAGASAPDTTRVLELSNYLPWQLLRDTDTMSMDHSLEVRVPLLDDAVVDHALGAHLDKAALVSAAAPQLAPLLAQPKRTFTLPFDAWLRGPLRSLCEEVIEAVPDLDARQAREFWRTRETSGAPWRQAWALATLGLWSSAGA